MNLLNRKIRSVQAYRIQKVISKIKTLRDQLKIEACIISLSAKLPRGNSNILSITLRLTFPINYVGRPICTNMLRGVVH